MLNKAGSMEPQMKTRESLTSKEYQIMHRAAAKLQRWRKLMPDRHNLHSYLVASANPQWEGKIDRSCSASV